MTNTNQSPAGGDVEAREAAAIALGPFGMGIAVANAAIDAYLSKLTSTKPEPSRIADDVAWLRAQAVNTAKAMTMLQEHRTADYKARGDLDANYKGIEAHETREWAIADHITAIEADRDKFETGWKQAFDIGIRHQDRIEALQAENAALQSDKDRMRVALEYATHSGNCSKSVNFNSVCTCGLDELIAPLNPSKPAVVLSIPADTIVRTLQHWLDFDRAKRGREGLETTDDTNIISPPSWPTHGMLRNWIAFIKGLEEELARWKAAR